MPATPNEQRRSRRDFLDLIWKGLLFVCGLFALDALSRFFDYSSEPPRKTSFDLGPAVQFVVGCRTAVPEAQAVLSRSSDDFQAVSTVCPHLGCTVELTPDGFVCPCHTSRFSPSGALLHGPATRALQVLRVELADNGHLILHLTPS